MIPFWGTLNIRCRIIIGIQKGTIILTTTHIAVTYYYVVTAMDDEQQLQQRLFQEMMESDGSHKWPACKQRSSRCFVRFRV